MIIAYDVHVVREGRRRACASVDCDALARRVVAALAARGHESSISARAVWTDVSEVVAVVEAMAAQEVKPA